MSTYPPVRRMQKGKIPKRLVSGCAATNLPDPVYWATPRHLAGDDGGC